MHSHIRNVHFRLIQDERPALLTSGNGNRREILATLYGVEVARQMLEVLAEEEDLSVCGLYQPDQPHPLEPTRDHLLCEWTTRTRSGTGHCIGPGISHSADGGQISIIHPLPAITSRDGGCKCPSDQGGGAF